MMATKRKKKYTLSEKVFYGLGILIVVSMILGSILAATAPSF
jgi:cell division protein FtsL